MIDVQGLVAGVGPFGSDVDVYGHRFASIAPWMSVLLRGTSMKLWYTSLANFRAFHFQQCLI